LKDIEKLIKKSVPVKQWEGRSLEESSSKQLHTFNKNENSGSNKKIMIQKREAMLG
jgi:hypothetical protein